MLRSLILLPTVFIFFAARAQQGIMYLDKNWQKTKKRHAVYYREYSKEADLYKVNDYHADGGLYRTGYRTEVASECYANRRGHYVYYDERGKRMREGDFDSEGHRTGTWKYYCKNSDQLRSVEPYRYGEPDGHMVYYDEDSHKIARDVLYDKGRTMREEDYVKGDTLVTEHKYNGTDREEDKYGANGKIECRTRYHDGKIREERYVKGDTLVTESIYNGPDREKDTYYANGKLESKTLYHERKVVSSEYYDNQGVMYEGVDVHPDSTDLLNLVERMPSSGYDMNGYLGSNLHYPAEARKHNIEGRVEVKFFVDEDGTIADVSLKKGVGGGCEEEALRVVNAMPPWQPAMQNGTPVRVYFTLPIVFKLQ